MPTTISGFGAIALWLIVIMCLMVMFTVSKGLKWHRWTKDGKIFQTRAHMANARWGRVIAVVVLLAACYFGWPWLIYPFV